MGFIGVQPASVPLTASDITNDIINADKIADNSISEEHLDPTIITGLSALGAEPADTDEFLVSDAGTLKRMDYSYIKGGGVWNVISNTTVTSGSSSAVEIQNVFSTTYKYYHVLVRDMRPSTDGEGYRFRLMSGTNTVDSSTNYRYATEYRRSDISTGTSCQENDNKFTLTNNVASAANESGAMTSMWITLDKSTSASCSFKYSAISSFTDQQSNGKRSNLSTSAGKFYNNIGSLNPTGLYFFTEAGNITSINVTVYGLVQS